MKKCQREVKCQTTSLPLNFMLEEEVIGHDLLVKVEWKTGDKKQTEDIKLYKKIWY